MRKPIKFGHLKSRTESKILGVKSNLPRLRALELEQLSLSLIKSHVSLPLLLRCAQEIARPQRGLRPGSTACLLLLSPKGIKATRDTWVRPVGVPVKFCKDGPHKSLYENASPFWLACPVDEPHRTEPFI